MCVVGVRLASPRKSLWTRERGQHTTTHLWRRGWTDGLLPPATPMTSRAGVGGEAGPGIHIDWAKSGPLMTKATSRRHREAEGLFPYIAAAMQRRRSTNRGPFTSQPPFSSIAPGPTRHSPSHLGRRAGCGRAGGRAGCSSADRIDSSPLTKNPNALRSASAATPGLFLAALTSRHNVMT